jgi:hypothetical protein
VVREAVQYSEGSREIRLEDLPQVVRERVMKGETEQVPTMGMT